MSELLSNLGLGLGVVFQFINWNVLGFSIPIPMNLVFCLIWLEPSRINNVYR